jgi:addiction module RelE/StbE family toxin
MKIIITPKAQKHYRKIPQSAQKKIKKQIATLEKDPLIGKKLEGELEGARSLRAWPYRIIYTIDTKHQTIYVVSIAHRQGVYK